jgi:ribosome-binding protein aMBF1 (putative translation factor)
VSPGVQGCSGLSVVSQWLNKYPDLGYLTARDIMPHMANSKLYKVFEKALTQARHEKGLTQAEVASRLGKPQSFVSKYESGERRLDVIEFIEVCEALMISSFQIIEEISTNDPKEKIDS